METLESNTAVAQSLDARAWEQAYNRDGGHINYKVVVHESEEGFSISCPGLPGCWS